MVKGYFRGTFRKDPQDDRDYKFSATDEIKIKTASPVPPSIDHTDMMSPVKYQGDLGSCVAFAACAMKEWQEQKEQLSEEESGKDYKRTEDYYNLSEQWIYWNCKKIDPWPNEEGTNIRSAMKVLSKIGVPIEQGWPYTDDPINIGKPENWAHLIARWAKIGSYWRVTNLSELKIALLEAPVVIGLDLFEEFFTWKEKGMDYIPLPAKPKEYYGGHALCAVGYDDEKKLIKFKNSWSIFWGDRGYGYVPYSYIKKYMDDAWAARDMQVVISDISGKQILSKPEI